MTLMNVLIENYPFATIKPNRGVGYVRVKCVEKEFNTKCIPRQGWCVDGTRFVPVELLDVAGLVPGAHEGKGMGNQFLDDLRQADALIHVIDISGSTNAVGENVKMGSYNPINDVKFLEEELTYWIYGILKNSWKKFARRIEQGNKELHKEIAQQFSGIKISEAHIKTALKEFNKKASDWTNDDLFKFADKLRILSKPIIIAANKIDKPTGEKNLEQLKKEFPNYKIIGCSAEVELALREAANKGLIKYIPGETNFEILKKDLPDNQKNALNFMKNFLDKYGSTGIQKILDTVVFEMLKYIAIFPGGVKGLKDSKGRILPDVFLLPKGSTALDFAYYIHTEIGDKFVKAIDVRTKKALGKEYKLKNRDVIEIMTT